MAFAQFAAPIAAPIAAQIAAPPLRFARGTVIRALALFRPSLVPLRAGSNSMDDKSLHVDDAWKSRAQAEKEAAAAGVGEPSEEDMGFPPASIPLLINTLAMQILSALGQIPDPNSGKAMIFKPLAQHLIDMLGVLEEKTQGNLTADEQQMLTEVLAQLRILYVQTPDPPSTAGSGLQLPPDAGPTKSSIVLP